MTNPARPSTPYEATTTLTTLSTEILHQILTYLDTPDLLSLSRTTHPLRTLSLDPLLHTYRLHLSARHLSRLLPQRPPKTSLTPPHARILLSKTHVLSLRIAKSLTRIRLAHALDHRPRAADLVRRAILLPAASPAAPAIAPLLIQPRHQLARHRLRDSLHRQLARRPDRRALVAHNILPAECERGAVAPALVATRRRVMREALKDGLRAWVDGCAVRQRRRASLLDESEVKSVGALVRRFTARQRRGEERARGERRRWRRGLDGGGGGGGCGDGDGGGGGGIGCGGGEGEGGCARQAWAERDVRQSDSTGAWSQPTRAKVLGLKRYWEGVIRSAG